LPFIEYLPRFNYNIICLFEFSNQSAKSILMIRKRRTCHSSTIVLICILTIFLFSCLSPVLSQPTEAVDSLKNKINGTIDEDQIDQILRLVEVYKNYNQYDSAEVYLAKATLNAEELKYYSGSAKAYLHQGSIYWQKYNNYTESLKAYEKSKEFSVLSRDTSEIYVVNSSIGTIHALNGQYEKALQYMQLASDGAKQANDFSGVIGLMVNLSNNHLYIADIRKRTEYLEQAEKLASKHQQSLTNEIKYNLKINLVDAYIEEGKLEKGDKILQILIAELKEKRLKVYLGRAYFSLMKVKSLKREYQEVIDVAADIFDLGKMVGYNQMIDLGAYGYRAGAYCKTNQILKAKSDIVKFKSYLSTINTNDKVEYLKLVSELYSCVNQVDSAFVYFQHYTILKDSLTNLDVTKRVAELSELYQNELKENKIRTLELLRDKQENKIKTRNILIVFLLFLALLVGGFVYLFNQRKKMKAINDLNQLEQKLLSLQMNPHFIFNSISSIQNFLYAKEDLPTAIIYLSKFAALMRQILELSREKYISIAEEIEILKNYIELQQLRFQNSFEYVISVDPAIDIFNTMVPPLITQPFVENSIEHGKIYAMKNGKVEISIRKLRGSVQLEISDNGVGVSTVNVKETRENHTKKSLATKITKERLALLSKLSNHKFKLLMEENLENGITVKIRLPKLGFEFS